jgi:methylase of polypeptide subunit release factors
VVSEDDALFELLGQLEARDYRFTTVTPETHARALARPRQAITIRDIFGWNRPFEAAQIEPMILDLMRRADAIEELSGRLRSRIRVASLDRRLFLHSAFPTTAADSVFFGPDTYRFCTFIASELSAMPRPNWIVDMGAGTGAGGIMAAGKSPGARLSLVDINPAAARLARINARFAGVDAEVVTGSGIPPGCDLVIANPPYMMDDAGRSYRHGGGLLGGEVSLDWASQALASLTPGGTLLLYTGAAIVDGGSPLSQAISELARKERVDLTSRELDPDVFGEELSKPDYTGVERIAVVGVRMLRC